MFRKINHILLFLCLQLPLYGQKTGYQSFENISLGSEASVITCFIQDHQGLMWIGSDKGLFSYDAYSVQQHFSFGTQNNAYIHCGITIDSTYLYLGTDNGLLIYNYKTDKYENPEISFPLNIRALAIRKNILWLGTLNGLYTYDLVTQKLKKISKEIYKDLPHETIYSIISFKDDQLYIGTYDGFCRYISEKDTFERINLPVNQHKSNQFINALLEDPSRNCIWIGTEGNLFKYIPDTQKTERIDIFHDNSVKSLALDGNGYLLAGTDNGLFIYHESDLLRHVLHDSRNPQSLSNNIIWNIFVDKEKNTWLGTDYGISLSLHNNSFRYIPISQITGTGEGNRFYSLYKDSKGIYWFGGTNGLIRTEKNADTYHHTAWYKMGNRQYPLAHNRIRQIYEDRERQLWIATDGSINRYDYTTGQFIRYNIIDSTKTYNSNWVYNIFEDDENRLWIATCLGGIFVVDKHRLMQDKSEQYIAEHNYSVQNGLSGMFVNQIIPDKEGNIWVLLYNNGIDKINIRTGEITKIPATTWNNEKTLNFIICDQSGKIWIGFRGGIACITPSDHQSKVIKLDEFSNNEVLSMAEVNDHIWISTTDGVWVVNKQNLDVKRLNIADKTFTNLFYDPISDRIYMGSVDGLAITSPAILKTNIYNYPIFLTALYVNNHPVGTDNQIVHQSIRYSQSIDLNYKQNNLSFEFSDLSYSLEEKNKFVYKLTGVDNEWNLLKQNINKITYNNLDYGKYQLIINKLDAHGKPSDNQYILSIRVNPPWYYTIWAKSIYVVLFISLIIWTINFFRVKNRLKFERMEKERILEQSKSKIDFFSNISHDFKTPLSMIIAPVSKLLVEAKSQTVASQLEIIRRNAMKLNSLIHEVLDFNRVDSNTEAYLILSRVEFISFAKSLFNIFEEDTIKEKELTFVFQSNCDQLYMDIDVIKFESILNNLFSNASKYTTAGGEITFSIHVNNESGLLEITVSDTGSGIPAQDIPYIFQRFFQSSKTSGKKEGTGIGLYLVKTYAELHGGQVNVTSEENKGTALDLIIPIQKKEDPKEPEISTERKTEEPSGQPLVLIVEDTAEIANFIYQILHKKYRCKIAENGKIGLELCSKLLPDLIIADVMMPVMNGLEMCQKIKKNIPTSTIPIILLTAKNDKETELESIHLNIEAFIPKPFEPDILLSRVEQLLNSKQQQETKVRMDAISTPKAIEAVSIDEKFLSNIIAIIEEHVSDSDLNVNSLCEMSGISNKQIYRKVKQLTGMTPVEYIKSIRMKKAAMLLHQKKFTVAEVMYMVGFSNHSYFSKCFHSEFGKTPRQFLEES